MSEGAKMPESATSRQPQNREWEIQIRTAETFTVIVRAHSAVAAEERAKALVKNPPTQDAVESVTAWCDRKVVRVLDAKPTSLELYPAEEPSSPDGVS